MATFNSCSFIGRLGKDPDFNVLASGKPVAKFSLAVDQGKDSQGKSNPAMWLNIVAWEKLAEIVEKYACKGMQVFVQGRLVVRSYDDKNGVKRQAVDVVASTVQLLEKRTTPEQAGSSTLAEEYDPFLSDLDLP